MSACKKIYAVDFDNTLAITHFPEIEAPITRMINLCKRLQREGNILILWTCRCGDDLVAAVDFCNEHGIVFDYINKNTPENIEQWGNDSRKIFAHVYIDDKSYNPEKEDSDDMKYLRTWQDFEEAVEDLWNKAFKIAEPILEAIKEFVEKTANIFSNERKEGIKNGKQNIERDMPLLRSISNDRIRRRSDSTTTGRKSNTFLPVRRSTGVSRSSKQTINSKAARDRTIRRRQRAV